MQIDQTAEQPVAMTCADHQGVCMEHGGLSHSRIVEQVSGGR